ncbi:MAG: hypothetical protein ACKO3W_01675, partial [bacterium]
NDAPPKPPAGVRPEDAQEDKGEKTGENAGENAGDRTKNGVRNGARDGARGDDGTSDSRNKDDTDGKDRGRGRRTPERQIAPPKPPPPVAAKERSYTWFPEIAEAGGGRAEILKAQDSLVAEIAELTIADRYRDEFADFFAAFRLLCR